MNNFSYIKANTPEEAQRIATSSRKTRFLAGGTDLIPLMKDRIFSPATVVDISGWPGAALIEGTDRGLLIGALTSLSSIACNELVRREYTALAEACNLAASPQLRNMGTLAGNLLQQTRCWYYRGPHNCWMKGGQVCYARDGENENHAIFMTRPSESKCVSAHPSDPGAALLALGATVLILTSSGPFEMPITEFFAIPTESSLTYTKLPVGALITSIRLPKTGQGHRSSYTKAMARASWAFALAGVAISANIVGTTIEQARIAVTGVAPVPFRATNVERQLVNTEVGHVDYDVLAKLLLADATPLAQNDYKVDLLGALFKEGLADLLQ